MIELSGIAAQQKRLGALTTTAASAVIRRGDFILGDEVATLENRLAQQVGRRCCVSCGSGTDALALMLMAEGIGEGDAVFVPAFTFAATADTVVMQGATPVFVDVDEETMCLSPGRLRAAAERVRAGGRLRPRAVIAVDLFGHPADYGAICAVAEQMGMTVLEDAAQSLGACRGTQAAGSFGRLSGTSFFPTKPLGCWGDGGAVFTDCPDTAELLRSLRVHGRGKSRYEYERIGMNSRLDTIQAAVLLAKLDPFYRRELPARRNLAAGYTARRSGIVRTPAVRAGDLPSWAQYTIRLKNRRQRERLRQFLSARSIPTGIYYPKPLPLQAAFENFAGVERFPVSEALSETVLSLPMHAYVSDGQFELIARAVEDFMRMGDC